MLLKSRIKLCPKILEHRRFLVTSPPASQSFRKWYQQLWTTERTNLPPYNHFTQIGDPVLRQQAALVPEEHIKSPEIEAIVEQMVRVLRKFDCVGIAAPQIGVSLRIIAIEFKGSIRKDLPEVVYQTRQMSELPLTVYINPVLTVTNYTKLKHPEGCMSVRGYSAEVERFEGIKLSGINQQGAKSELALSGWNARIAQHEMDHLEGKLYTDHMDRSTFSCTCWEAVNTKSGRVEIPFYK
ncbi:peptide deformylase, mitochondrial [Drosophila ficusphila]|uniref:peptide deformylase, mitochondrial n=1 Tax=Drosophila ficusphila TaxID=30025 RepID=UPI0007E7FFAD|nr:peptide deformylase, mitochondrial [Drosophila ficusphila]XP_017057497.1 peptide deformylase, mitochondrial [Drosophila ficusphila]